MSIQLQYPSLIRFLPLSTPINPLLESLGLTVCEGIVNNVVTAHLAQPHLSSCLVSFTLGRIRKKGKDISTTTAPTTPTIYSSPHLFFFNRKTRRPSQLSSRAVVCPTPNSPPYCTLSFEFFWLAYELPASGMHHSQQVQFVPDSSLPPGQRDLEALEHLKKIIKSNQHEIFRATPQPAALASLYRGPLPSAVPPHPEQIPNNSMEMPNTAPSSPTFETPPPSTFTSDTHSAHVLAAAQGASRSSVCNDTVRTAPASSSPTDL